MSYSNRSASCVTEDVDASHSAKATQTSDTAPGDSADLFEIDIKIPSTSKALRNDYRPPTSAQLKMRAIFSNRGAPTSPMTDDERREIWGTDDEDDDDDDRSSMGDISIDEEDDDDSNCDEYEEFNWFEAINGRIRSKGTKDDPLGYCNSALIRRDEIRSIFYHEIEQPSQESSAMGFDLFDRYGRLKPAFKKSESGSGIWGDELDDGDIHLIDEVHIDEQHRRKGLGRKLVQDVLEKGHAKSNPTTYIAIAHVAPLTFDVDYECEGKTKEEELEICDRLRHVSKCFWRSLGFRRIGTTEWFARAGDKHHRCHSLPAEQDFDPPSLPSAPAILDGLLKTLEPLEEDEARLDAIQRVLGTYAPEDSTWTSTDREGNTLLHHIAADMGGPKCVKWILSRCPKLADARNSRGNTALETFEARLEVIRTQQVWMRKINPASDQFSGYSEAQVETLVALKGLDHPTPQDLLRLTYGCTCGQCQSGFLSPRMRFVVHTCAEMQRDMLFDGLSNGEHFVAQFDYMLEYLPEHVLENLISNRSMREGFTNLFGHFARCLRRREVPLSKVILTIALSASEWPPVTKHYFDRGGTIYAVGSAVFQHAMRQSLCAGDGQTEEVFEEDINELPPCRNDDEFGFASGMCGYERVCQVR